MTTSLRLPSLVERLRARYPLVAVIAADLHDGEAQVAAAAREAGLEVEHTADAAATVAALLRRTSGEVVAPGVLLSTDAAGLAAAPHLVRPLMGALPSAERAGVTVVLLASHLPEVAAWSRDLVRLLLPLPQPAELAPLVAAALPALDAPAKAAAVRALQGLTFAQARRALRRVRALAPPAAVAALTDEKRDVLAASGAVEVVQAVPSADEVGGLDALQAWLQRQAQALEPAARDFGVPLPRGVLLVGVQGCGKTLCAKAAAAILGVPLLRLDPGRLHGGQRTPDENLRHALQVAEAMAPVVLWIDEIDKAFAASGSTDDSARVFGSLLTWLGEGRHGVFAAATANRLTHLPAELLRKGRFDETFFVDVPDQVGRAAIFAVALRRSGRDPADFDLERLVRASERLTGAEIEQAVAEALLIAYCDGRAERPGAPGQAFRAERLGAPGQAFRAEPSGAPGQAFRAAGSAEGATWHRALTVADIEGVLSKVVPFVETYDLQVRELRQWAKRHCRPASRDRSLHELFAAAKEKR